MTVAAHGDVRRQVRERWLKRCACLDGACLLPRVPVQHRRRRVAGPL